MGQNNLKLSWSCLLGPFLMLKVQQWPAAWPWPQPLPDDWLGGEPSPNFPDLRNYWVYSEKDESRSIAWDILSKSPGKSAWNNQWSHRSSLTSHFFTISRTVVKLSRNPGQNSKRGNNAGYWGVQHRLAYLLTDQFDTFCENLKVIGPKSLELYRFLWPHAGFGRKVLNVCNFVKNRLLEQIVNKNTKTRMVTDFTKCICRFTRFCILVPKISQTDFFSNTDY